MADEPVGRGGESLRDELSKVPSWIWLGAVGAGVVLYLVRRGSPSSAAASAPASSGIPMDVTPNLADITAPVSQAPAPDAGTTTPPAPPASAPAVQTYPLANGQRGNYQQFWSGLQQLPSGTYWIPDASNAQAPGDSGYYGNYQQMWSYQQQQQQLQAANNPPSGSGGSSGYADWQQRASQAHGAQFGPWLQEGAGYAGMQAAPADPAPAPGTLRAMAVVHRARLDAMLHQIWPDTGTEM